MNTSIIKKILGTLTVVLLTFIIPIVVMTVTSTSTLDNRSKAAVDTGSISSYNPTTQKKDTSDNLINKVYPFIVGIIVFLWFVTILIYLGYRYKDKR